MDSKSSVEEALQCGVRVKLDRSLVDSVLADDPGYFPFSGGLHTYLIRVAWTTSIAILVESVRETHETRNNLKLLSHYTLQYRLGLC